MSGIVYEPRIAFTLRYFQRLAASVKLQKRFLAGIRFAGRRRSPFVGDRINAVYLYPDFDQQSGLGQPDGILLTEKNKLIIVRVEDEIDPKKWHGVLDGLIRGKKKEWFWYEQNTATFFTLYRATPLYQLERFYMLGGRPILHIRGPNTFRRLCSLLPFSDQFDERVTARVCSMDNRVVLDQIFERIWSVKDYYVVLISMRGTPLSPVRFYFDSLKKIAEVWSKFRPKYIRSLIKYPRLADVRMMNLVLSKPSKVIFDIGRFGVFFHGAARKVS